MTDKLQSGQQLQVNDELVSNNGLVKLVLQTDGDLVLYRSHFGIALWASNTAGKSADHAAMKADGNLVVESAGGAVYWQSNTAGNPSASAILQDDGDLSIYDTVSNRLWTSNIRPDFYSPAIQYTGNNGYEYVET